MPEIVLRQVGRQDHTFQIGVDREQVGLWWWADIPAIFCVWGGVEVVSLNDTGIGKDEIQAAGLFECALECRCKLAIFGHICSVEGCSGQLFGYLGSALFVDVEDVYSPVLRGGQSFGYRQA